MNLSEKYNRNKESFHEDLREKGDKNQITVKKKEASFDDEQPLYYMFNNTDTDRSCEFQKPYSTAPIPIILMSLGRSGSSITWDTLSKLLGTTTKAHEITGGNHDKTKYFFNHIEDESWPVHKLCVIQRKNIEQFDGPVISGFQWKPFRFSLDHPMGKAGLQAIANHTAPEIKVIFLSRNPLDKLISNLKHKGYENSKELLPHCAVGDEECIKSHQAHSKVTISPIGQELVHRMTAGLENKRYCEEVLNSYGIQFHSVTYDDLYSNEQDDVKPWVKIFEFLGRGPEKVENYRKDLTMKDIRDTFAVAKTSSSRHEDLIENYEEVKKTLEDAGMGYLLH